VPKFYVYEKVAKRMYPRKALELMPEMKICGKRYYIVGLEAEDIDVPLHPGCNTELAEKLEAAGLAVRTKRGGWVFPRNILALAGIIDPLDLAKCGILADRDLFLMLKKKYASESE